MILAILPLVDMSVAHMFQKRLHLPCVISCTYYILDCFSLGTSYSLGKHKNLHGGEI